MVRHGRLRWLGHLERKSVDDWVSACRRLVVEGTRGRGRKTWEQCVKDDMKLLGLHPEWTIFRDMWRDLIWGKRLTFVSDLQENAQNSLFPQPSHLGHVLIPRLRFVSTGPPGPCHYDLGVCFKLSLLLLLLLLLLTLYLVWKEERFQNK